jgi:hypothetical protein
MLWGHPCKGDSLLPLQYFITTTAVWRKDYQLIVYAYCVLIRIFVWIRGYIQNIPDWRCTNHKNNKYTLVKTAHVLPATCNLAHWLTRHGSPTTHRCFALPLLVYRWRHQSGIFWIPPRTRTSGRAGLPWGTLSLHGSCIRRHDAEFLLFVVRGRNSETKTKHGNFVLLWCNQNYFLDQYYVAYLLFSLYIRYT